MGSELLRRLRLLLSEAFLFLWGLLLWSLLMFPLETRLNIIICLIIDFQRGRRGSGRALFLFLFFYLFRLFGGLFSFIRVISIGGVVSGGVIGILVLMINKRAEKSGDRHPEFLVPINNWIVRILSFRFYY
jgi:hypothetical protein